jgi:hypothetical protein
MKFNYKEAIVDYTRIEHEPRSANADVVAFAKWLAEEVDYPECLGHVSDYSTKIPRYKLYEEEEEDE